MNQRHPTLATLADTDLPRLPTKALVREMYRTSNHSTPQQTTPETVALAGTHSCILEAGRPSSRVTQQ